MLTDSEKDILNAVSIPILVMDGLEIFFSNQQATRLLDLRHPETLKRLKEILSHLPVEPGKIQDGATHTIKFASRSHEQQTLKITMHSVGSLLFLTIRDITKEAQLLQEFILLKKELEAQKVLKQKRDAEILHLQRNIDLVRHAFSDGIAIIDNNLNIIETNTYNKNNGYERLKRKKCYELIGKRRQCDNCPLISHAKLDLKKEIIGHKKEDKYITEECIASPDSNNYILIFKDTTKQIKLIEKIKEQQNTIEHQRDIFMHLSQIMTEMQQNIKTEDIIYNFLKTLIRLLNANSAILLVEGIRKKGAPWLSIAINMSQEQVDSFIKEFMKHPMRKHQSIFIHIDKMPDTRYSWEQIPIYKTIDKQIGILILETINKPADYQAILTTYMDALNSYLNNKLLSMQLEERANIDGLTGLYNRSYHELIIKELQINAAKYKTPFAVIMIDLNGLKPVNDNHGHEAGDKLIITTAELIKKTCRTDDIPVRLGGDEFCVLLPQTDSQQAAIVAERIKTVCENEKLLLPNGTEINISLSMGYAASNEVAPEEVLKTADERMYADKAKYYETHEKAR